MNSIITIASLEAYIRRIAKLNQEAPTSHFLYRGHKNYKYESTPSLFRNLGWIKNEDQMVKSLVAKQPKEFDEDITTFERLVRAQHYGLPTRLLDVTRNPLVALYFACEEATEKQANGKEVHRAGEVILYSPMAAKRKFFDSDTLACLSNLSLMNADEIAAMSHHLLLCREDAQEAFPDDIEEFHMRITTRFNEHPNVRRLAQLVAVERPGFEPRIRPFDLANPIYAQPRKLHPRLSAQDGSFLAFGLFWDLDRYTFIEDIERTEIRIPHDKKKAIREGLFRIGIGDETLFPEIDRASQQIKSEFES